MRCVAWVTSGPMPSPGMRTMLYIFAFQQLACVSPIRNSATVNRQGCRLFVCFFPQVLPFACKCYDSALLRLAAIRQQFIAEFGRLRSMICATATMLILLVAWDHPAHNPLFQDLQTHGVPIAGERRLKLPPPTLPNGLDAAVERAVLEKIFGDRYSVEEFVRESIVGPFVLTFPDLGGRNLALAASTYGSWYTGI